MFRSLRSTTRFGINAFMYLYARSRSNAQRLWSPPCPLRLYGPTRGRGRFPSGRREGHLPTSQKPPPGATSPSPSPLFLCSLSLHCSSLLLTCVSIVFLGSQLRPSMLHAAATIKTVQTRKPTSSIYISESRDNLSGPSRETADIAKGPFELAGRIVETRSTIWNSLSTFILEAWHLML